VGYITGRVREEGAEKRDPCQNDGRLVSLGLLWMQRGDREREAEGRGMDEWE